MGSRARARKPKVESRKPVLSYRRAMADDRRRGPRKDPAKDFRPAPVRPGQVEPDLPEVTDPDLLRVLQGAPGRRRPAEPLDPPMPPLAGSRPVRATPPVPAAPTVSRPPLRRDPPAPSTAPIARKLLESLDPELPPERPLPSSRPSVQPPLRPPAGPRPVRGRPLEDLDPDLPPAAAPDPILAPPTDSRPPPVASEAAAAPSEAPAKPAAGPVKAVPRVPRYDPARNSRWVGAGLVLTLAFGGVLAWREAVRPRSSEAYARASAMFDAAFAELGEAVWEEPRLLAALDLLNTVPDDSLDADAARHLASRIANGRAEAIRARKRRQAALVLPAAPAGAPTSPAPGAAPQPSTPSRILVGDTFEQFRACYGECVVEVEPFVEKKGVRRGMAWGLVESPDCAAKFPDFKDNLVFVLEGRVFNIVPRGRVERVRPPPGQETPAPAGAAKPAVAPAPARTGTPAGASAAEGAPPAAP